MSDRLIELGLQADEPRDTVTPQNDIAALVDRLLVLIGTSAIESDTLKTADFRAKLEKFRRRIALSHSSDPELGFLTRESLSLCQDYFKRACKYLVDRESEFGEVIDVLREALGRLAGEANSFNVKLMNSSRRFSGLSEIQDIRELKKQIAQEIREFDRVVQEKQKQEEATFAKLSRKVEMLQTNLHRSFEQASLDSLTRIANRGSFDRVIEQWTASHRDGGKTFVLAMLDIDDFKTVNDTHGHQVGDRVLLCAAQWFGKYVRNSDFLARFGGEEFAILLADSQLSQAEVKFTELVSRIGSCSYEYKKGDEDCEVRFTVSCGLAECSSEETAENLIRRADEALYEAKRTGKNKVVLAKKQKSLWKTLKPFVPFRD